MTDDDNGADERDPTANVRHNLEVAVRRQDDLRNAESDHIREVMDVRSKYEDMLRRAESQRIDAIRAVDVGAVNRAAEVQSAAATALATQVAVSAEALRNQVGATSNAAAIALAAALEPIQKDIADLRRVQYEQAGSKSAVIETKTEQRSTSQAVWMIVGIVSSVLFGLLGVGIGVGGLIYALTQ